MTSTTKQRRRPSAPPPKRSTGTAIVVGAVIAVIALVALGVVLLAGGDDGEDTSSPTPSASAPGASSPSESLELPPEYVGEIRPVTVTGTPLPELGDDEAVGEVVPTVIGESFDGTPVTIGPRTDGPTMVVVVAHWCPHCNDEVPRLVQLHDEGRLPTDLRVVGISTAANAQRPNFPPSQWIADTQWPFEVVADGIDADGSFVAAGAYGVDSFPFVTLFDADGRVLARWSGESDVDELAERIDQAVGA